MPATPSFRKADRYKESSFRTYNFGMPTRYDRSLWMRFCQTRLWDRTVVAEIGPELPSLRVLDVGCATGRLLDALGKAGGRRLAGVDLAPRIVEVARAKLAAAGIPADLRVADAEDSLPWPSGSFDVAILTGVLHHFYRPLDALAEIRRVLDPGGRILVIDPSFFPPVRQLVNLALRVAPHQGDYRFYSRKGAAELLRRAGFRTERPRTAGLWSHLILASRNHTGRARGARHRAGAVVMDRRKALGNDVDCACCGRWVVFHLAARGTPWCPSVERKPARSINTSAPSRSSTTPCGRIRALRRREHRDARSPGAAGRA